MTEQISVLIVEDHDMVSEMMAAALERDKDINVVGRVPSIAAARTAIATEAVDVVLMDYQLPDGNGVTAAEEIRNEHPAIRVVIVTAIDDDTVLRDALRGGCSGYVLKTDAVSSLAAAIRAAHTGSTAVSPSMLAHLLEPRDGTRHRASDQLTERELEVLRLLAVGMAGRDIGVRLHLSSSTVRNHTQSILEKLDSHSKLEAVTKAMRAGLVSVPR